MYKQKLMIVFSSLECEMTEHLLFLIFNVILVAGMLNEFVVMSIFFQW